MVVTGQGRGQGQDWREIVQGDHARRRGGGIAGQIAGGGGDADRPIVQGRDINRGGTPGAAADGGGAGQGGVHSVGQGEADHPAVFQPGGCAGDGEAIVLGCVHPVVTGQGRGQGQGGKDDDGQTGGCPDGTRERVDQIPAHDGVAAGAVADGGDHTGVIRRQQIKMAWQAGKFGQGRAVCAAHAHDPGAGKNRGIAQPWLDQQRMRIAGGIHQYAAIRAQDRIAAEAGPYCGGAGAQFDLYLTGLVVDGAPGRAVDTNRWWCHWGYSCAENAAHRNP